LRCSTFEPVSNSSAVISKQKSNSRETGIRVSSLGYPNLFGKKGYVVVVVVVEKQEFKAEFPNGNFVLVMVP